MRPDISEFSYGYAVTEELVRWGGASVTAAPVFPSLIDEGRSGGGYDVMLSRPGIPLFLQFKLSDCMVRNNAQEVQDGLFNIPFYRMHLRPARHSRQHEMLLDLEAAGQEVYYSAPAFHTPGELNDAYLNRTVRASSIWLRPSFIGPLPDDRDHCVAFRIPGATVFRSRPKRIPQPVAFKDFSSFVETALSSRGREALKPDSLQKLAEQITEIAEKRPDITKSKKREAREKLRQHPALERISFYSQIYLGCSVFILSSEEDLRRPE